MSNCFKKNKVGEYIEGYISNKENFNGVLFLLKEPNSDNQDRFWFKKCINKEITNKVSKRVGTLYINKFNIFLGYLPSNYKLEDCAFANIIPDKGESTESKNYKNLKENKFERFKEIINDEELKEKIKYIFTCSDIFDAIKNKNAETKIIEDGIKYRDNIKKRMMVFNKINIYEIYHPAYWKYPIENNTQN